MQKYDVESYLTSAKFYWHNRNLWINFIDGINESNQPKFGVAIVSVVLNANEMWLVREFTDLSLCKKYPEYSLYFNLQKIFSQLIFEEDKSCPIEPGTKVTIPSNKHLSITIDEKIACGSNSLTIVLQSPDNNDVLGLYWDYNVTASSDCIDYSVEEERKKADLKKAVISTTLVNVSRDYVASNFGQEDSYFETDVFADNKDKTWFSFPNGFDSQSNVIFKNTYWAESRHQVWNLQNSNITGPCDEAIEFSIDDLFLRIVKLFLFQGKDCPIEKGANLTASVTYPDMEVSTYTLLPCGINTLYFYLYTSNPETYVGYFVGSWNVPNTTQCRDHSTY